MWAGLLGVVVVEVLVGFVYLEVEGFLVYFVLSDLC